MMKEKFSFEEQYRARTIFRICNMTLMILLLLVMLVPLLKVVSDSLDKSTTYGLTFYPKNFSLAAYHTIFTRESFYRPFMISVFTTVTGTLIGLTLTTLGAYVLSKRDLVGRDFLAMFVFITMIFRGGIVPTFLVVKSLHMTNTLFAVLLPTAVNVVFMILMRNFFDQIPKSLLESAEMDGASAMRTFLGIVLPLSKAGLAAIGLFYIVQYWNSFFDYVIYISNTDLFNFQLKLRELVLNQQVLNDPSVVGYGDMVNNAAVIVAILPFLFIYPFAQRYFITGVTLGAVKE
jgi:putative aldouronate transport system permease protein